MNMHPLLKEHILKDLYGHPQRAKFIAELCALGPVVLYGGAIRDHATKFYTGSNDIVRVKDFDLVVDCDPPQLGALVRCTTETEDEDKSMPNSHKIDRLAVDVWTRIHTEGQPLDVHRVADLALLNWNAVVLDLQTNIFHFGDKLNRSTSWHYIEQLQHGYLELHHESFMLPEPSIRRLCRFIGSEHCRQVGPAAKEYLRNFSKTKPPSVNPGVRALSLPPPPPLRQEFIP